MKKRRSLLLLTGIFFTAVIVGVQGVEEVSNDSPLMRADVITIDALKSLGDLEQPPVVSICLKRIGNPLNLNGLRIPADNR
jgi:hypothetical protein